MRITIITPVYLPEASIDDFWNYGFCTVNQAKALSHLGHDVTVITRFSQAAQIEKDGVTYAFVTDDLPPAPRSWQVSKPVTRMAKEIDADIIHLHGMNRPLFILKLTADAAPAARVLGEYHGEAIMKPPMGILQRMSLRRLDGFIFANPAASDLWRTQLRLKTERFHHCVECAPNRAYGSRQSARKRTGLNGNPIILWNSRAIKRRNPDVVLACFERHLRDRPDTACHFHMMIPDYEADTLAKIQSMIAASDRLQRHVTLVVDRIPQSAMTDYYNSADFIISGSADDPYGYGIADAMSCGVVPIIPKSPSFLKITNHGQAGFVWDLSDPGSLVDIFNALPTDRGNIAELSERVHALFAETLSMAAQAASLERIYATALQQSKAC